MDPAAHDLRPPLDWGVAARAYPGQAESGDRHLVQPFPDGVLVAVVDGLGHGEEAAVAAQAAVAALTARAGDSVLALVRDCHEKLRRTRGVVLSLASFNVRDETVTWLGVGNVEGLLLHADASGKLVRESVLLRGGVVGYQLPTLRASVLPVQRGDLLLFATDGIQAGFGDGLALHDAPRQIADGILTRHGKDTDDALVLVARYLGGAP
jgi:serine/threonine protein phosphatase PrpC